MMHESRAVLPPTRKGGIRDNKKRWLSHRCLRLTVWSIVIGMVWMIGTLVFSNNNNHTKETTIKKNVPRKDSNKIRTKQTNVRNEEEKEENGDIISIGYAISITGCPGEDAYSLYDGAAVLKHSIDLAHNRKDQSKYTHHQLHAFVHKDAVECASGPLQELQYQVHVVDVPIAVEEIESKSVREQIVRNGCCGEKELIKLYAYTLLEHTIVVHLDIDTLVMKPLDELFDTMIHNDIQLLPSHLQHISKETKKARRDSIDFLFTRDYNMSSQRMKHVGVQGGFFLLKPSQQVYDQFIGILRKGHYTSRGWGDAGYGPFYGSLTIQGILPYFYDHVQKGKTSVELNRCYVNNMADNPRENKTVNNVVSGDCKDRREECLDCRSVPVDNVLTTHFTVCYKPWTCSPHMYREMLQHGLCYEFHAKWFQVRQQLQETLSLPPPPPIDGKKPHLSHFLGYCTRLGEKGYVPIPRPGNNPPSN